MILFIRMYIKINKRYIINGISDRLTQDLEQNKYFKIGMSTKIFMMILSEPRLG